MAAGWIVSKTYRKPQFEQAGEKRRIGIALEYCHATGEWCWIASEAAYATVLSKVGADAIARVMRSQPIAGEVDVEVAVRPVERRINAEADRAARFAAEEVA